MKYDKQLPRVTCSQLQLDNLAQASQRAGISKAQIIRNLIDGIEIKENDQEFKKLELRRVFLLNNISNNQNQLTKYVNMKRDLHRKILLGLNALNDNIREVLSREFK